MVTPWEEERNMLDYTWLQEEDNAGGLATAGQCWEPDSE